MSLPPVLGLDAAPEAVDGGGWRIRLPVRAERIGVDREVVVYERVRVVRRPIEDVEHVETEIRREELRTTREGEPRVIERDTERDTPDPRR
jgi:uncharacterized protein (TIGR02271 family)